MNGEKDWKSDLILLVMLLMIIVQMLASIVQKDIIKELDAKVQILIEYERKSNV